jgi:replicative DNA helicase
LMRQASGIDIDILPNSIESEKCILGAIMLDNRCFDMAAEKLNISHFYLRANQRIYSAMLQLRRESLPVDLVTLSGKLRGLNEFEQTGGATYIAALIDGVPRTDDIEPYIRLVLQKAQIRELYKVSRQVAAMCIEDPDDPELVSRSQQMIFDACASSGETGFTHVADVAMEYLQELEAMEAGSDGSAMPTGFDDFDSSTMGLHRGELVIIAGRPSNGKTTLAKNIASYISAHGFIAGFFSLEDGKKRIVERILAAKARMDSNHIRSGRLDAGQWERLAGAVQQLGHSAYYLNDEASLSAMDIRTRAQRLKQTTGRLDVVVVDYLQLMKGKGASKQEIVGDNANELKAIAKDLDIAVVATSQLNRQSEGRENNEPELSDLRQSGEIEQAADIVAFIYNEDDKIAGDVATIKMAKNRNGRAGDFFKLRYFKPEHRLENYAGY